jgi:GNAT superfamily N-acetyltransferase
VVSEPRASDVPPGVVTRRATEADLGRVVELIALGVLPGATSAEDRADLTPYRAALREIQDTSGAVLVAELDGEVVGVCQLVVFRHVQVRGGLCAEIESVHVHPDHRGRGIGSVLVRDAVSRARTLGCYRVQLTSNRARTEAHHFYERLGFEPSHVGFKLPLP